MGMMFWGCSGSEKRPELLHEDWKTIEEQGRGSRVRFYMDDSNEAANRWVDSYVAEAVKQKFGITLVRVPLATNVTVSRLVAAEAKEAASGVDLLWVNGVNFRKAREKGVLFGPFAEKLPNYIRYVDKRLAAFDFGFPMEGFEVPWGRSQFVLEYDSAKMEQPPRSYLDLLEWVKEHPGKFTYPAPPDFVGSAFVRQVFYGVAGGPQRFESGWDQKLYDDVAPLVWGYFNEIKPYLWRAGIEYPKNVAELDKLFAAGEIDFSMAYGPQHAAAMIRKGAFPPTVRTYQTVGGTLYNMHCLAIAGDAASKAGAMVVANFLLSPEAQLSKYQPDNWGDFPSIQLDSLHKKEWDGFASVKLDEATLPPEELEKHALPEIPSEYVEALERDWQKKVK